VHIKYPRGITSMVAKSDCPIPLFGRVYHAKAGWHVKVEVLTDKWYVQDKWYENGLAPITNGMRSMPEIILGGQGQYNSHSIQATRVDEFGIPMANEEESGINRSNSCAP
jgi:hypothetical protein